jgi:hypothetical protein
MPKKQQQGSQAGRKSLEMTAEGAAGGRPGSGSLSKDGSMRLQPGEREDVKAERLRVEAMTDESEAAPIVVRDLRKVFPAQDGAKPKVGRLGWADLGLVGWELMEAGGSCGR